MSRSQQVAYIRVSTIDQNNVRQLSGMSFDKTFEDTCSGKDTNRPALNDLISYVREGDVVHVHDISRMARNVEDLLRLIKELNSKGVTVHFHNESLIFDGDDNPIQNLMITLLGAVYRFEREMILERQREGIAKAKEAGKYRGRKPSVDRDKVLALLRDGMSIRKTAKALEIAPSTVQRIKMNA